MPQAGKRCCSWCLKILDTNITDQEVYCCLLCGKTDESFEEKFSDERLYHTHGLMPNPRRKENG